MEKHASYLFRELLRGQGVQLGHLVRERESVGEALAEQDDLGD